MKVLIKIAFGALLAGGTASAIYADPVGGWLSPNGVSGGASTTVPGSMQVGSTSGAGAGQSGMLGMAPTMSLADLQMRTHQLHEQTRADARHVQHLQQIARKEKDIIKLNCVNDKLVQLKPEMNIADAAEAQLEVSRDTERMAIFTSISQAAETVRRLREEADQCIGESISQGSESSNSFTGPQVPDDPTKGLPGGELEPPGFVSPFM
jgi:hypothetical protein